MIQHNVESKKNYPNSEMLLQYLKIKYSFLIKSFIPISEYIFLVFIIYDAL